jgi:PPM family protein phosphatase
MTAFAWGAATDTGRLREGNEDFLLAADGLFVVADGMGGHHGGEVASHVAVETLGDLVEDNGRLTTDALVDAVQKANDALVGRADDDPELKGMGTTLCALALVEADDRDVLAVVNVGDSRLYLLKEGELEQITEDHSLVATLERQGRLTQAEAAVHPQRNILTRALGIDSKVMVDSWEILPFVGDRYLVCSDGLFNEVDDDRIAATLRRLADPGEAARELVRLANEGGGRDNISVVVVDIVDDEGRAEGTANTDRIVSTVHGPDRVLATARVSKDGRQDPGSTDVSENGESPTGRKRRNALTWRVVLFLFAVVAVAGVALGAIVYSGTNTYYVGFEGEEVVIFRGQPGGVLWIDPSPEERTGLFRDDLPERVLSDLEEGREFSNLNGAGEFVDNLREQVVDDEPAPAEPEAAPPGDPVAPTTTAPTSPPPGG